MRVKKAEQEALAEKYREAHRTKMIAQVASLAHQRASVFGFSFAWIHGGTR